MNILESIKKRKRKRLMPLIIAAALVIIVLTALEFSGRIAPATPEKTLRKMLSAEIRHDKSLKLLAKKHAAFKDEIIYYALDNMDEVLPGTEKYEAALWLAIYTKKQEYENYSLARSDYKNIQAYLQGTYETLNALYKRDMKCSQNRYFETETAKNEELLYTLVKNANGELAYIEQDEAFRELTVYTGIIRTNISDAGYPPVKAGHFWSNYYKTDQNYSCKGNLLVIESLLKFKPEDLTRYYQLAGIVNEFK